MRSGVRPLLGRVVSVVFSEASLVALILTIEPKTGLTGWGIAAVTGSILLGCLYIASDTVSTLRHAPRRYGANQRQERRIKRFMLRWIKHGGRIVIFSRDLTWVDSEVKDLLLRKALADELTIVVPRETALITELREAGAAVVRYDVNYVIKSRFTIVNYGREGAEVAVGRRVDGAHVIETFAQGGDAVYSLAEDLLEILTRHPQS